MRPMRWHRVRAGLYRSARGHTVERMHGDHISAATPWRLVDPNGEWMGDHATLRSAWDSLYCL